MKAAERMEKYFAGERVDCIPHGILSAQEALCEIYGYKTSEMYNDFEVFAEVVERAREDFEIEDVSIGLNLRTLGAAMGSILFYPDHGFERMEKEILQDYADLDKIREVDPYNNAILTPRLERAIKIKERFPDINVCTGVTGPVSTAAAIRPIEQVLRDVRKRPEELKELIAIAVDNSLKWVEVFTKEVGPAPASVADPVTCTDILGKKQFEEFSLPELKRLISRMNEITGAKTSLHICGHTKGIWEDLRELDISSFSVDNCEDIEETREVLGDIFTIVGNVPPVDILRNGSIDNIVESVKDCIRKGSTSPNGYILNTGCQVPIGTPRENIEAFINAAKTYGRDAKLGELPAGMQEE